MSATGIGASVKRKEDHRFITGKGRYVDDVNRPGQAYAHFLRSPHAHATIDKIDASAALASPGVVAVFTGEDIAADKIGGLICGWMIHSKDGSPMKAGPHPVLAQGKVRYVGDHVAVVIADTYAQAREAAEKIVVDYGVLPAAMDLRAVTQPGAAQIHEVSANNTVYNWHLGDKAATDAAFAAAKHVTKLDLVNNRLIPNAMEPRAAVGEYDAGTDGLTLFTTSQNPHVARLVLSAFIGIAPEHKLRVIAPDVGGGFGSKIFIYAEETVCVWAARKIDRPVKWTADRTEAFLSDAHGRDHVSHAELAIDASGKITALRAHTIANLGAYLSTFSSCVPTYLYALLLSGQYNIPNIYAEVDAVYTNTAPVDAYRGAGRPEATFLVERIVEIAARELGMDPAEFRRKNFVTSFPRSFSPTTPAIMPARSTRRWRWPTTRASARARRPPPPRASCAASAYRPISKLAASRRRRRSGHWAPASACGNRRKSGSTRSAPSKSSRVRTATARAMRRPSPSSCRTAWASRSTMCRSSTATPTRCRWAWAPMARARALSACPPSRRRSTRSRPRRRKSPATCSRRPKATSSSRTASSPSRAPTSRSTSARSRCRPISRTSSTARSWSPG
jgi:CO/xanthine dehydrogenase Mo-binding subunit